MANIPLHVSDNEFRRLFEPFRASYAHLVRAGKHGPSKGFGFVSFDHRADAAEANTYFNANDGENAVIDGKRIRVMQANRDQIPPWEREKYPNLLNTHAKTGNHNGREGRYEREGDGKDYREAYDTRARHRDDMDRDRYGHHSSSSNSTRERRSYRDYAPMENDDVRGAERSGYRRDRYGQGQEARERRAYASPQHRDEETSVRYNSERYYQRSETVDRRRGGRDPYDNHHPQQTSQQPQQYTSQPDDRRVRSSPHRMCRRRITHGYL